MAVENVTLTSVHRNWYPGNLKCYNNSKYQRSPDTRIETDVLSGPIKSLRETTNNLENFQFGSLHYTLSTAIQNSFPSEHWISSVSDRTVLPAGV